MQISYHLQQCAAYLYQTKCCDGLQTDSCHVVAFATRHMSVELAAATIAAGQSDTVTVPFVPLGAVRHSPG